MNKPTNKVVRKICDRMDEWFSESGVSEHVSLEL